MNQWINWSLQSQLGLLPSLGSIHPWAAASLLCVHLVLLSSLLTACDLGSGSWLFHWSKLEVEFVSARFFGIGFSFCRLDETNRPVSQPLVGLQDLLGCWPSSDDLLHCLLALEEVLHADVLSWVVAMIDWSHSELARSTMFKVVLMDNHHRIEESVFLIRVN